MSTLSLTHVVCVVLYQPNSAMDEDEISYFASMTEDEFAEYLEAAEQEYKEKQQQQQEKQQEEMEENNNNAYAAYQYGNGNGRRHLFESIQTLCGTCEQKCVDDEDIKQSQEYYQEMAELFAEAMCTEAGDGVNYIGHTCGSNGRTIELALFTDQNCMYLAGEQNAYSLYQQAVANSYGNGDADGDGQQDYDWSADDLAYGYMQLVTEMFQDEFSCSMGAVRSYDGSVRFFDVCLLLSFESSLSFTHFFLILFHLFFRHYRSPVKPVKPFSKMLSPSLSARPTTTRTRTRTRTTDRSNTNTTEEHIPASLMVMTWSTVKILRMCAGLFLSLKPTWPQDSPTPSQENPGHPCSEMRTNSLVVPSLVL